MAIREYGLGYTDTVARQPTEWHPQDWLLATEALLRYADSWPDVNTRGGRARELVVAIALDQGLRMTEIHH